MQTPEKTNPAQAAFASPLDDVQCSVTGKRWVRRDVVARDVETLIQRGTPPILADILSARGVAPDAAETFLNPRLRDHLPDPFVLQGMKAAAARLADAVIQGEQLGVFGDYDVDGTVSSALLKRYFAALGVTCHVHLPDRQAEGYGPNLPALEQLTAAGAGVIITADCGATAVSVLTDAAEAGMDVIVLDHHLMTEIPPAVAVVNPQRPDDTSGLTMLSAAGVVFMTMVAVNRVLRERGFFGDARPEPNLLQWLDLVGLSLVCDVMPLKGLCRVIVRQGLALIERFGPDMARGNPGIRALAEEAGVEGAATATHFGFSIGPRINAAGRIGHAQMAFDLLTTDDPERARQLAERLGALNGTRQGVEKAVLAEAVAQGEQKGGRETVAPLIVAGDGWHPGVIGIVAGRLKERFDRPAIVIGFEGEEGKGSGRSLPGVDLGEAIAEAVRAGVLSGGGGHPMAAGLSIQRAQLPAFDAFLAARLSEPIEAARAERALLLDGLVSAASVTASLADDVALAGPFGNGNAEPRFALLEARIVHHRIVGETHLSFTAQDGAGRQARCIAFGCVDTPLGEALFAAAQSGALIHLAGRVKADTWRGGDAGQLQVEDAALFNAS